MDAGEDPHGEGVISAFESSVELIESMKGELALELYLPTKMPKRPFIDHEVGWMHAGDLKRGSGGGQIIASR